MPVLILIGLMLWAVFGSPKNDAANWFWADAPAPWENVDAFYYPNRSNLSVHVQRLGLETVDQCRRWVAAQAARMDDRGVRRGDYECAFGAMGSLGDLKVYRRTVR